MDQHEILNETEVRFGETGYVLIKRMNIAARNKEFIAIDRGFIGKNGERIVQNRVTLPNDTTLLDHIARLLTRI